MQKQLNYWFVLVALLVSISSQFDESDFENADVEDVSSKGCDPGQVPNIDTTCQECYAGLYADTSIQQCLICPLNTYSDTKANVDCTPCPGDKNTTDTGSNSVDLCVDVCEIPATVQSYYEMVETNSLLDAGNRVVAGDQIILQCIDDDHTVVKTEFTHLILTCTATFKTLALPNTCVNSNEAAEQNPGGLICYDSCYKETSGGRTRYVKLVGGGTVIVESCPLAECKVNEDTCVSVSYKDTFNDINRIHFSCQQSSLFDSEICKSSGANEDEIDDCKVQRCKTERCNDPESTKITSSSRGLPVTLLILVSSTLLNLFWR
ncbi:sushi, von Willebrand factor type A, EGF and pentraxin domain-containing protein 1-like [Bolinopsis microptera]|uniref:sushi, von Willebrand factor type A, EGF and pentraxin domain-containing protein 1-like n=1 Tax=Bolinopsis microptera TaxID=2820187 RepID=UPI00307A5FA9